MARRLPIEAKAPQQILDDLVWLAPEFASPASTKGRKQRLFRSLLMQNQGCALDLWLSDEQPGDAVSEP